MATPRIKKLRRVYGFDEVAIVPGEVTINPELVSTDFPIDGITLKMPVLASAMDAVGSPKFVGKMNELGGLGVMNLEGVQARYDDPDEILNLIVTTPQDEVTSLLQKLYTAPHTT
ncbi:Uncharacterized oxidoreductase MSMEG_1603/MSMEI_1564 [Geodia barretti]|uniref:Uncharacterized oxidoreductase MSMEG_1603/MSMEI_1564 n=1 Tax=Geodia barretti TaxID=519541 RepID=A0AA35RQ52_GEOBA|nr:Uncharacterized oxidoreductase MSMEG_1603/MSMEI_1564 [Geodia barretti]